MLTALLVYAALGAIVGMLAGLLGVGGGLVVVPMLVFSFGYQQFPPSLIMPLAIGTSMASIMFTSLSSSLAHWRQGSVDWSIVRRVAGGILIGTYLGSLVATHLPASWLKGIFVVFLCYAAFQMLFGGKPKPARHLPGPVGMNLVGLGIGSLSSLVGIGGGMISVPFMLWSNVPIHTAVGTSAAIGFPIAVGGCLSYILNGQGAPDLPAWSLGFIYLPAMAGIVAVSTLTAPYGARLSRRLPVGRLKACFAVLLIVVGARMVYGLF